MTKNSIKEKGYIIIILKCKMTKNKIMTAPKMQFILQKISKK